MTNPMGIFKSTFSMRKMYFFLFALLASSMLYSQEICNNGIDDDGDGLIDLNDVTDCVCGQASIPSMIPNPSFDTMNCCPSTYSQVNCAGSWVQASDATSDYMNTCGFVFGAATAAGLVPFPNGNGILGAIFMPGWQEYVGACLNSPMIAGTPYTLQMNIASTPCDGQGGQCNNGIIDYGNIDIVLYGTTSCASLPFSGSGCPPAPWTVLGQFNYTPMPSWGVISITFTPSVNIAAIIVGSPCTLPASYLAPPSGCYPYFYFDNMVLNTTSNFNTISQTGSQCANNIQLQSSTTSGATYQWYLNGVALPGETNPTIDISLNGYPNGNYTVMVTTSTGCSTAATTVTSSPQVTATFTNTTVCVGSSTQFTDNSTAATGSITGWAWDFGDPASAGNNTSALQNPSHVFTTSGTFNVTLVSTSSTGCSATIVIPVTVAALPVPSFTYTQICGSNLLNFTNTSTVTAPSTITGVTWDFGDPASAPNNTSSATNPSHTYTALGVYTVTLIITTSDGCSQTITQQVTVSQNATAAFTSTTVCSNSPMAFTNNSLNSSNYHWDFGVAALTNDTSNLVNPSYTYTSGGVYTVTLIASPGPCADTTTLIVNVNTGPQVAFLAPSVCIGATTAFTDQSTVSSGTITGWHWDFGVTTATNDTSNIPSPNFTYAAAGTYNVTLTCTSSNGCVTTLMVPVTVSALPTANFTSSIGCQGTPTTLTDISVPGSGSITNWTWDFGDGSPTSSTQNPSHTYTNDSTFNVSLIITNTAGCIDTIALPVVVSSIPVVAFSADTLAGCPLLCVNFTDLSTISSGTITAWTWDFGDQTPASTQQNPSHCFAISGTYDITLVASAGGGCTNTLTIQNMITVNPVPHASFTASPIPTTILSPTVYFTDLSTGNPTTWNWGFGDPTTLSDSSLLQNTQYTYSSETGGIYPVTLTVTNQYGCVDDTTIDVIVEPDFAFFIPNAFTPNGDGKNEGFMGAGYGIATYELWVFDRWGNLIFNTKDINEAWNGTVENKGGDLVQIDVYVWKVVLTDVFNKKHKYIGHVSVVK
jgi:gliding motility-associated-like protein